MPTRTDFPKDQDWYEDEDNVPYFNKGKNGQALKDFRVLVEIGQISKYPLFWREFACQLFEDIDDVQKELQAYKNELLAACEHVEKLCEERTKLRELVEAAREEIFTEPVSTCTCYVCSGCRDLKSKLEMALKELDGEK